MARVSKRAVAAIGAATAVIAGMAITLAVLSPSAPPESVAVSTPLTGPVATSGSPTSSSASAPRSVPVAAHALGPSKPVSLEVPSIGVRTGKLMDLGIKADQSLEVPPDAVSAGWFTGAPTPGEVGPSVLAGHVNYNHVPGVFTRLHELKVGAEATVHRADGTTAVFTIYRVDHYPKESFPTEKVYGDTAAPELRLITCGGDFNRAARQYLDNVVAYGKLARVFRT